MPDDELLGLAEAGKLHEPAVLDAQVKRMMADKKLRRVRRATSPASGWKSAIWTSMKPDPKKVPRLGPELRDAMRTETRMFFEYVLRENRPIGDFIDAKYTFLNERLAKFTASTGVKGPRFPQAWNSPPISAAAC
jgi:hypothetical protein